MNEVYPLPGLAGSAELLIDTNLLVLFVVGSVNRARIEQFKRTRQYSKSDYDLLLRVLGECKSLYTLAHVMAEVSNLTDLTGPERLRARQLLKDALVILKEPSLPSARAAQSDHYEQLGLVGAAIAIAAREHKCAVLTDDLDLYCALSRQGIHTINFTHLRAIAWGV
jgi:hypothetical protein